MKTNKLNLFMIFFFCENNEKFQFENDFFPDHVEAFF